MMFLIDVFVNYFKVSLFVSAVVFTLFVLLQMDKKRNSLNHKYLINLLLAVQLVVPLQLSIVHIGMPHYYTIALAETLKTTDSNLMMQMQSIGDLGNREYFAWLSTIWLLVLVVILLTKVCIYLHFKQNLTKWEESSSEPMLSKLLEQCIKDYGMKGNAVNVKLNKKLKTPILIGVLKPQIILPLNPYSHEEIKHIFSHELVHYKRRDILYKLLLNLCLCLHWYNPMIYYFVKKANKNLEYYCDAQIIKGKNTTFKLSYAKAMLKCASQGGNVPNLFSTSMSGKVNEIKKRIQFVISEEIEFKKSAILPMVLATVLLFTCSAGQVGIRHLERYEDYVFTYENGIGDITTEVSPLEIQISKAIQQEVTVANAFARVYDKNEIFVSLELVKGATLTPDLQATINDIVNHFAKDMNVQFMQI